MKQLSLIEYIDIVYQEYTKSYFKKEGEDYFHYNVIFMYLLYIVEWKYCIEFNQKVSDIIWIKNSSPRIKNKDHKNGAEKKGFQFNNKYDFLIGEDCIKIAEENRKYNQKYKKEKIHTTNYNLLLVIKWVLKKFSLKQYSDLAHLVHCTYPFVVSEKDDEMDLLALSLDYFIIEEPSKSGVEGMINYLKGKK